MIGLINLNLLKLNLGKRRLRTGPGAKRQARTSLLGLAFDGHRLEAVLVRRSNGSARVQSATAVTLELNLLTDAPELVGREIRNHLDRAGISERQCAVSIPLEWAMTAQIALPDLPPEDLDSFLTIEAERGFPVAPETLALMTSRCQSPSGARLATLIAMPKDNLAALQRVLKSAQLRPLSFSLGLTALQDPREAGSGGVVALVVGENSVQLEVCGGGGIAALRTLPAALDHDGARKMPYADVVARDLRITLGQLPADLRERIQQVKVFGTNDELARFTEDLRTRAKLMGLEVVTETRYEPGQFGMTLPGDTPVSAALSVALRQLTGREAVFDFLPPKVSAWKQLTSQYSSQKLVATGAVLAALVLVVAAAFIVQQWQLSRWRSQWARIRPQVSELDSMQQQIRQYRPWFDESFRSLAILQKLTESFPEDGSVTAKTVEIRDPGAVMCTGTARDQQALLRVVDQLRAQKEFSSVQVDQIRGKQFTLNLHWGEGGSQ